MSVKKIVQEIFSSFNGKKSYDKKDTFFSSIAKDDIEKILEAQQSKQSAYETAGFPANNLTAAIVQRQILSSY